MMTTSKPDALDAFMASHTRMGELLAALTEAHANHLGCNPVTVHWGHVGSIGEAVRMLEECARFLNVEPSKE